MTFLSCQKRCGSLACELWHEEAITITERGGRFDISEKQDLIRREEELIVIAALSRESIREHCSTLPKELSSS